jgi:hypothetical protein
MNSISGMSERGRNGTNNVTLSPTHGPAGTQVIVTVSSTDGVLGWIGAVFDDTNVSVAGVMGGNGGRCITHSAVNTGNSASFNWTVPAGTPNGKVFKAKVISLNGRVGGGAAQRFALGEATFSTCVPGGANCSCVIEPFYLGGFYPPYCNDTSLFCIDGRCRECESGLETCSCMPGDMCLNSLVCNTTISRCHRANCKSGAVNCPCRDSQYCDNVLTAKCDGTMCISSLQPYVMRTPSPTPPNSLDPSQHAALMSVFDAIGEFAVCVWCFGSLIDTQAACQALAFALVLMSPLLAHRRLHAPTRIVSVAWAA